MELPYPRCWKAPTKERPGTRRNPASEWSSPLARELGVVLLAKSIALFLIWLAFFSDPIDEGLTDIAVKEAVFGQRPSDMEPHHGR